uniref:Uncharacterized protein n=1 Tax=Planktothrix pseudagardhii TaxID=132604 RepID=A0A9W4CJB5_9CYAN|nr:hypothetical protein NO713_02081 [Planktothrix pseudagardhii]
MPTFFLILEIFAIKSIGWLGMITPIGALALICGWACLTIAALKTSTIATI